MDSSKRTPANERNTPPRTPSSRTVDGGARSSEGVDNVANGRALLLACASAGSLEDVSSECGDLMLDDHFSSSSSLLYSAPSCISDFTERWVTEVMRQYYMTQFGQKSPLPQGIGNFSVEMAGNNEIKPEADDGEVQVSHLYNDNIFTAFFYVQNFTRLNALKVQTILVCFRV